MRLSVHFTWTTTSALAIHTGLARAGGADRTARKRRLGTTEVPELRGEAVKAVIREAAERILCWQGKVGGGNRPGQSIPTDPALVRLFAHEWSKPGQPHSSARYFFRGALGRMMPVPNGTTRDAELMEVASTSIVLESGTAKTNSLRSVEVWKPGIIFELDIEGAGGDWRSGTEDWKDLGLLLLAITSADSIGGEWRIGRGEIGVGNLQYQVDSDPAISMKTILPDALDGMFADWFCEASV